MPTTRRKIIEIDESKCDGCGQCVTACIEGAIQIVDGKAKLVSEVYCDGLGACLGECPRGAISIVERTAEAFDEEATQRHLASARAADAPSASSHTCPGTTARSFNLNVLSAQGIHHAPRDVGKILHDAESSAEEGGRHDHHAERDEYAESQLSHWPIQLRLVSPSAPFFQNADLLVVADCVPFAYADFHVRLLQGRPVVIACPKLDERQTALDKLAAILTGSSVRSLTVVHMEVPCCTGLVRIAEAAVQLSGKAIPLEDITISVRGQRI